MDAEQRLTELTESLGNYERSRVGAADWSLDTTRALLVEPAGPRARRVQIGGSKGKGTTALYLDAMARQVGLRTAVFSSPHLHHTCERICIDGAPVAAAALVRSLEAVLERAEDLPRQPSYFEALAVAAVDLAEAAGVDLLLLEVGLGGRLDATTAVPVDATILVHLELEHTEVLGPTLADIAREKAQIMRPGLPAWLPPGADPAILAQLSAHATELGAREQPLQDCRVDAQESDSLRGQLADGRRFHLPGASAFELPAFRLALACLEELFPALSLPLDPAPRPALPGRFEICETPEGRYVLDVAHTPESTALLVAEWQRRFPGHRPAVLFGSAADKAWREELNLLSELADRFLVTALQGTRATDPEEMAAYLRQRGSKVEVVADAAAGLDRLRASKGMRLVAGSFYLVGAVRPVLRQL